MTLETFMVFSYYHKNELLVVVEIEYNRRYVLRLVEETTKHVLNLFRSTVKKNTQRQRAKIGLALQYNCHLLQYL